MQTTTQAALKTFLLPVESLHSESKVFLLFSKSQIVEVLREVSIQPVPFCADYIEGAASYSYRLLPVVSPEKVLGLEGTDLERSTRQYIVVRSSVVDPRSGANLQVIFSVGGKLVQPKAEIEQGLSGMCGVAQPDFLSDSTGVRAFFQQDETYYVVVDLNKLVLGNQ